MPERRPWASVSSTASTRLAAIRRHASDTVVPSGIVSALDSRSFFTVLSPLGKQAQTNSKSNLWRSRLETEATKRKEKIDQSFPRAYVSWFGEAGLDAAFPFPFPLAAAAAAAAEGSSDLREEADGGRLLVRRLGGAAEAAELMAKFAAELLEDSDAAAAAAGEAGAEGAVVILLRFNWQSLVLLR